MARIERTNEREFRALLDAEIVRVHPASEAQGLRDFARASFARVPIEEFEGRDISDVYQSCVFWWKLLEHGDPDVARVAVINPRIATHGWHSDRTIITVTQREMPFLLDSIRIELNRRSHAIFTLHSASFDVLRDRDQRVELLSEATSHVSGRSEAGCVRESLLYLEIEHIADDEACAALAGAIEEVLAGVLLVVADFAPMQKRLREVLQELEKRPPECVPPAELDEGRQFLEWLLDDRFTFLEMREVEAVEEDGEGTIREIPSRRLGLARRDDAAPLVERLGEMDARALRIWMEPNLLDFSKSSRRSSVHRGVYSDAITIKRFAQDGEVAGEVRLIGLYTSTVYTQSPFEIPVVRSKLDYLHEQAGVARDSHESRDLQHVLESHPRDELFQSSAFELARSTLAIARIQERKQVRLFVRRDRRGAIVSCLVYVPREIYDTQLRQRTQRILCEAFEASECEFTTHLSDSVLARTHFVLRTNPEHDAAPDLAAIEARIVAVARSWSETLGEDLVEKLGEGPGGALARAYAHAFPASYRDDFDPGVAIRDIEAMEALEGPGGIGMCFFRCDSDPANRLRFKLFHLDEILTLSSVIPILESLGVQVIGANPYRVRRSDGRDLWIQDFELEYECADHVELHHVKQRFPEAFASVWHGHAECDGFNRLILGTQLPWRDVAILRAYARYMKQITIHFSMHYIAEILSNHLAIAEDLVALFHAHFDPDLNLDPRFATGNQTRIEERLIAALDGVENLDEDRIIRRYIDLIRATLRTNFHQRAADGEAKDYFAFKLSPRDVPGVPKPCPRYEVFVYSPRVEGVHLRVGRVARGGIRWSDRLEDYRTEVLGLVKAQQVKNAVIVPVGAKGGFVTRQLPADASRDEIQAEAIACYQTFIRGLLDLTDNREDGRIVRPDRVVCKDEEDPYLVVAADKGTATFSDIANQVSHAYGFWLGDAFASGGSVGYDHKKMGITAKGAWVSIQRHFRECGIDVSSQPFSVVGIGDMSGDVFGNGMLLSPHIELVAAFNHAEIFLDPAPNAALGFEERRRLFETPGSNWSDYDAAKISTGGGVFRRSAKSVPISPEVRDCLQIEAARLTPSELIAAILRAPVDMLWNGGIGTYVKSSDESHESVEDKANDAVRIDARELRCRVIGEAGNLGITQLGRVEYCRLGGRANTDFVDNAAGVNCSDHEVNLKVLLSDLMSTGALSEADRRGILRDNTLAVEELVLADNDRQAQAISLAESQSLRRMGEFRRFIRKLEEGGKLDRALEFLPDDELLVERKAQGTGLTRPELSVLICYAKAILKEEVYASDLAHDEPISRYVETAFPRALRERFRDEIHRHQLKKEIVATQLANEIVNRMGFTFVSRLQASTGADIAEILRAYVATREVFELETRFREAEALEGAAGTGTQFQLMNDLMRLARTACRWFLRNRRGPIDITRECERFAPGVAEITSLLPSSLLGRPRQEWQRRFDAMRREGVPEGLARFVAEAPNLHACFSLIEAAESTGAPIHDVAEVYFSLSECLDLEWLREQIAELRIESHWQALSRESLMDDLERQQRELTVSVVHSAGESLGSGEAVKHAIEAWQQQHAQNERRFRALMGELHSSDALDLTMCTVALRELLDWTESANRVS